ncbi:PEP-CTERM sorting domain-containing protein [Verrucomicrobiota bacterium]
MMKKITMIVLSMMMVTCVCLGGTINYFTGGADRVYDINTSSPIVRDGGGGPGYVIALMQVVGGSVDDLTTGGFTDDIMLDTTSCNNLFVDGIYNANYAPTVGGFDVYVTIFNASDVVDETDLGSATSFVNLYGSGNSMLSPESVAVLAAPDIHSFDVGPSQADVSDWQAIPEPGTFVLFGLGMLTLAVRRRGKKKKN